MSHVITQVHGQAIQKSSYSKSLFEKLSQVFEMLGPMFRNKYLVEFFDQRTHLEFTFYIHFTHSLHTSNESPELSTELYLSPIFNLEILFSLNVFLFFLPFFFFSDINPIVPCVY